MHPALRPFPLLTSAAKGSLTVKTVTATIEIDATPAEVWAVLTDLASYPQWNPLFPEASGDLVAGKRITLKRPARAEADFPSLNEAIKNRAENR